MAGFVLEFERHIVELEETIERLRALPTTGGISVDDQIAELERKANELRRKTFADLSPYQRTQISRHPRRPFTLDYVDALMTDWQELKGDRNFMDDPAIVTGLARFHGRGVVVALCAVRSSHLAWDQLRQLRPQSETGGLRLRLLRPPTCLFPAGDSSVLRSGLVAARR